MLCDTRTWPLTAEAVEPGVAVCVREVGKDTVEWLIVETDRPNESAREYSPDHPRIKPLLGLRTGAEFVFAPGVKPRMGEVLAIQSKYLHRFEQARDSYQSRFHDRHDFQMVEVVQQLPDGTEQLDLTSIFAAENQRREYVEGIVEQYRERPMSIYMFSQFIGRDMFETMDALQSPGLGVRCWSGADDDWNRACNEMSRASTVVLDVTALFTLGRLGLLSRQFTRVGVNFVVSYGTLGHLRDLTSDKLRSSGRAHWVPTEDGGYNFLEVPQDEIHKERDFRDQVECWVRKNCTVVGCRELADVPPERRRQLIDVFGRDGAESLCLATRPAHILWTDDFTLAAFARVELNITRHTWTQVALWHAVEGGVMRGEEYATASAYLIGRGYTSLRVDSEAIAAAGVIANWSLTGWPFSRALELFRANQLPEKARVSIATLFLLRLFCQVSCPTTRRNVVFATLDRLARRQVVSQLAQDLSGKFGSDPFSALTLAGLVRSWLPRGTPR
jgi:hypothetical protein